MSIRRPTLAEWFNAHQHRTMWRENSFMVGTLDLDVTPIADDWTARGLTPHFPSILTRAAAVVAAAHPAVNRAYLRTLWGDRMVTFDGVHVVMPVRFEEQGRPILDAIVLRDADQRTALDLRDEIRAHVQAGLDSTTLTRLVARKPNTLLWRSVLRAVHFAAWRLPLLPGHGGAIGVTAPAPGHMDTRPMNFAGPTPLSMLIALTGIQRQDGRTRLNLGIMMNHLVCDGRTMGAFLQDFGALLEGEHGVETLR